MEKRKRETLTLADISRVIEMAWEDRTPFEAIARLYGLQEKEVIHLMRGNMKRSSFRLWRERVSGRCTKHVSRRTYAEADARFCSPHKRR